MPDAITIGGVTIREIASREGMDGLEQDSASRSWLLRGTPDPVVARSALLSDTQSLFNVYEFDGLRIESLARTIAGNNAWKFTANYGRYPGVGEYEISIDTTGGLTKLTNAYAQTAFPAAGETATNFGTAVDVQEGEVRGVDIIIPALRLTVTAKIDFNLYTNRITYAKELAALTGKTNNAGFLGFDAGELLFAGATGRIIADKDSTLTFEFIASQNVAGLTVGPIAGITKAGHDYAWVSHRRALDPTTQRQILQPVAMYVARTYGQANMNGTHIGELAA